MKVICIYYIHEISSCWTSFCAWPPSGPYTHDNTRLWSPMIPGHIDHEFASGSTSMGQQNVYILFTLLFITNMKCVCRDSHVRTHIGARVVPSFTLKRQLRITRNILNIWYKLQTLAQLADKAFDIVFCLTLITCLSYHQW